jgi:MFS family permease
MAGHALSATGQTLGTVAVALVVFNRTGSNAWVAAAAASRLLPYVLFSALGGVVADRLGWVRTLRLSSAVRAVLTAALAVAAAADAPAAAVIVLAFASAAAGTPCYPAVAATTPAVVPAADLVAANGLLTTVESTAFIVGPAIGGAVLALANPTAAFIANVVVLVAAFLALSRLDAVSKTGGDESLGRAALAGVRAVASSPDAAAPLVLVMVANWVYGVALVVLLPVATDVLGAGKQGYGYLNSALGVGAVAGVVVANRLARARRPFLAIGAAAASTSIPFAVLAGVGSFPVAAALMAVSGMGGVVTEVLAVTLLQRAVPEQLLARVFGLFDALAVSAILVGSLTTPFLLDAAGIDGTLLLVGAVVPAAVLLGTRRLVGFSRLDRLDRHDALVDLLAGLPILYGAGRAALEALAAAATVEDVAPGQAVVVEGGRPDDFFAIREGDFAVVQSTGAGERGLRVQGPGDGFGEMGLLTGAPRSATVRAVGPGVVVRIRGADFIAAVNGVRALNSGARP